MEGWSAIAREYDPIKVGSIDGTDTEPHDRGILRALRASYHCNESGDPRKTIFIGRLNYNTSQDVIEHKFKPFGKIVKTRLVRDIVTNFSKGYAFIEYASRHDAKEAIMKMNHVVIDDKKVIVLWECERVLLNWVPRRLGGGFSGRKESGQLRFGGEEKPWRRPIVAPLMGKKADSMGWDGGANGEKGSGDGVERRESDGREVRRRDEDYKVEKRNRDDEYERRKEMRGRNESYRWNSPRTSKNVEHEKECRHDERKKNNRDEKRRSHSRERDSRDRRKKRSKEKESNRMKESISKERRDRSKDRRKSVSKDRKRNYEKFKNGEKRMESKDERLKREKKHKTSKKREKDIKKERSEKEEKEKASGRSLQSMEEMASITAPTATPANNKKRVRSQLSLSPDDTT